MANGKHPKCSCLDGFCGCKFNLGNRWHIARFSRFECGINAIDMLAMVFGPPKNHARHGKAKQ